MRKKQTILLNGMEMCKLQINEERYFHDKRFSGDSNRNAASKYYSVRKGIHNRRNKLLADYCINKKVLEYGCGSGTGSTRLLQLDAIVTGIDISYEGILNAQKKFPKEKYKATYCVMNAEDMAFKDTWCDVVVGLGILHHINVYAAYNEIVRVLSADGHLILEEPLGHNILINIFRKLTPFMRTSNERPLKQNDIKLLNKYFYHVEAEYYSLITLLAVPFRKTGVFEKLYAGLEGLDKLILKIPWIRKYAWTVLIHASCPKK